MHKLSIDASLPFMTLLYSTNSNNNNNLISIFSLVGIESFPAYFEGEIYIKIIGIEEMANQRCIRIEHRRLKRYRFMILNSTRVNIPGSTFPRFIPSYLYMDLYRIL